jgi:uncharacterized protein YeaO (DUF488 family)
MKRKSINQVVDNPRENEFYILVSRHYPQRLRFDGLSMEDEENPIDFKDLDMAPSQELLGDWKNDKISWNDYRQRFIEEKTRILIERKKEIYRDMAGGKEPVLVCIEEDEEYPECHTWIILDILGEEAE